LGMLWRDQPKSKKKKKKEPLVETESIDDLEKELMEISETISNDNNEKVLRDLDAKTFDDDASGVEYSVADNTSEPSSEEKIVEID
jgi:serine protease inhibitor ecotin